MPLRMKAYSKTSLKEQSRTKRFSDPNLVGQFILSTGLVSDPEGWTTERIGGWHLSRYPSLPVISLRGEDGSPVGWLLGYPIDGNGSLAIDGDEIRVPGLSDGTESSVEDFLYGFGGRFLAALVGVRHPRLYLDPCGSLAAVYCRHQERIASTPNLISFDAQTPYRVDLIHALGIPYTNAKFPLDLTPRHNVIRLLPNHYLDLSKWESVRHWPKKPLHNEGSVEEAVAVIAEITKRNIAAVVSKNPTYLRLTSGQDSRMLLACAKDFIDRLELFTVPIPDDVGLVDVDISTRIARRFRMRHLVPEYQEPKPSDLSEYMFRIAYGTGELRGWQASTMFRKADPSYIQLDGGVGGLERMGEGIGLRPGETITMKNLPDRFVRDCKAPRTSQMLALFKRWIETAPAVNAFQVLDLFEIEQVYGGWGGNLLYAESPDPGTIFYPMCHREIIERMITLPDEYRLKAILMRDIIRREWPELLSWPFSQPVGWKKIVQSAHNALKNLEFHGNRVRKMVRNPKGVARRILEGSLHATHTVSH